MSIQDPLPTDPQTPLEAAVEASGTVADGDVLASSLPPAAVFSAKSSDEGAIIRGLLTSEGIPAVYNARVGIMTPDSAMAGEVLVSIADEARARELIAAYSQPVTDEELDAAAEGIGE